MESWWSQDAALQLNFNFSLSPTTFHTVPIGKISMSGSKNYVYVIPFQGFFEIILEMLTVLHYFKVITEGAKNCTLSDFFT